MSECLLDCRACQPRIVIHHGDSIGVINRIRQSTIGQGSEQAFPHKNCNGFWAAGCYCCSTATANGSLTVTRVSRSGKLSRSTSPPCNSAKRLTIANPKPEPCCSYHLRPN